VPLSCTLSALHCHLHLPKCLRPDPNRPLWPDLACESLRDEMTGDHVSESFSEITKFKVLQNSLTVYVCLTMTVSGTDLLLTIESGVEGRPSMYVETTKSALYHFKLKLEQAQASLDYDAEYYDLLSSILYTRFALAICSISLL